MKHAFIESSLPTKAKDNIAENLFIFHSAVVLEAVKSNASLTVDTIGFFLTKSAEIVNSSTLNTTRIQ